jgi:hypothetical protein
VCSSDLIDGSAAAWVVGDTTDGCPSGNVVGHDLTASNNQAALDVSDNSVGHDLEVVDDAGRTTVSANTVGHDARCSGGGPAAVGVGNVAGHGEGCPTAAPASLTVTIAGLPDGTAAAVAVAGPDAFAQTLIASTTLRQLVAGTYGVTAAAVSLPGGIYTPTVSGSPVSLSAGGAGAGAVHSAGGGG